MKTKEKGDEKKEKKEKMEGKRVVQSTNQEKKWKEMKYKKDMYGGDI